MAVIKEYRCSEHGVFESASMHPLCPAEDCAIAPERVFETAPAIGGKGKAKLMDKLAGEVMQQHGLTDLSNRKGSVVQSMGNYVEPQRVSGNPMQAIAEGRANPRGAFLLTDHFKGGGEARVTNRAPVPPAPTLAERTMLIKEKA